MTQVAIRTRQNSIASPSKPLPGGNCPVGRGPSQAVNRELQTTYSTANTPAKRTMPHPARRPCGPRKIQRKSRTGRTTAWPGIPADSPGFFRCGKEDVPSRSHELVGSITLLLSDTALCWTLFRDVAHAAVRRIRIGEDRCSRIPASRALTAWVPAISDNPSPRQPIIRPIRWKYSDLSRRIPGNDSLRQATSPIANIVSSKCVLLGPSSSRTNPPQKLGSGTLAS